jgi:RNA-binding protein
MTKNSQTQKLKKQSAELIPTLWVGKNGVNDAIVRELQDQLKLRKMIKVRILKAALSGSNRDNIARELGRVSGARLIELKGATAVYHSPYRVTRSPKNGRVNQRK